QVEVNIDYILLLVAKYHQSNCKDKTILDSIDKAVNSSTQLRSKKELIESFVASMNMIDNVDDGWHTYITEAKEKAIAAIIAEERKRAQERQEWLQKADQINKTEITLKVKCGESGKVFGSIQSANIADELKKLGIEVDRKKIVLPQPIKNIGT